MKMSDRFDVPTHVRAQVLQDETVILDLRNGVYFGLNHVGSHIWSLINTGNTLAEIVDFLAKEYSIPQREVEKDALALARELAERQLIEIKNFS